MTASGGAVATAHSVLPTATPQPQSSVQATHLFPSVAVAMGLFLGDGVLPLPQRLMRKILALEFVEMRELLPEEWLPSVEEGDQDSHSCCNSVAKKRKPPITNIFTWLQGNVALVGAVSTAYPGKVPS